MSQFAPIVAGLGASAIGAAFGGGKKNKPAFDLTNAYFTGLNQQNEQRAMGLGALDRYSDFVYGTRTPQWSPYGVATGYGQLGQPGRADRTRATAGGTGGGGASSSPQWSSLKQIAGVSDRLPGFNPPGTGYEFPLPWGPGTRSLLEYSGSELGGGGGSLLNTINAAGMSRKAENQDLVDRYLGGNDELYKGAMDEARAYGDSSASAINREYDDTVRRESDRIGGDLARRGFGNSTLAPAEVATNIVPNALAGKLGALANVRNSTADRLTGAALARAGAADERGRQIAPWLSGSSNEYTQQLLNAYQSPELMRAQTLAQPSSIYFGPYTRGMANAGQQSIQQPTGVTGNIAGALGQTGGFLQNYGMYDWLMGNRGTK